MRRSISQRHLIVVACLALVTGCVDHSAPPTTASANPAVHAAPPSAVSPSDDRSLTLDEYIETGLPAHDRSWTGQDMTRAAKALAAIAQKDAGHLPRYGSERSGAAFQRLTANDNLGLCRTRSLPLQQRLTDAMLHMQSSNEILQLYLAAFNKHAVGDSELVELVGVQLRISVEMFRLVDETLPTLDKDDPTYAARMKGLQRMRDGLASIVAGTLETLTETNTYRTSELKRLAGYMEATFPNLLPQLPAGSRSEFVTRLRFFVDDPKMQDLRPELDRLLATAERASKAAAKP